ncbi:MAG: hypothetical protein ACYC8T_29955 [Myxococcaceae bacterium]
MRRRVALGAVIVALGAFVFGASRLKTYVAESPGFCAHCHKTTPEFSAWTKGQHRGTPCQSCHHSSSEQGLAMLKSFMVDGAPAKPKRHAEVEVGSCAACHLSHDPNWPQVGASRGHRIHAVEQKIPCVKCHASGIHRFEPAATSCKECHGPHTVNVKGMHQVHCFACHNFTTAGADLKPTRRDCMGCHRAQGVLPSRFPEDAPMQFACAACHKPHVQSGHQMVDCTSCHQTIGTDGLHSRAGHVRCADCHRPHGWRSEREDCFRCHPATASHHGDKPCAGCHPFKAPHPEPD